MDRKDPPSAIGLSLQPKPCSICRRRKVKCDRLQPCGNCSRGNQVCTYDGLESRSDGLGLENTSQSSDNDLRERLSRLEQLMATMIMSGGAGRNQGPIQAISQPVSSAIGNASTSTAPQYLLNGDRESFQLTANFPTGHVVFKEGCSAYFDADFWPALISEVEDIRQVFNDSVGEAPWSSYSALGIPFTIPGAESFLVHPDLEQSNKLCKYFFEGVNPFVRVFHEGLFARELREYRRGTFTNPPEFEALLFAIYALTVSSLNEEVVERSFSSSKEILLARFELATQLALAKVNFMQSNKIHTLSASLHYLTLLFQQNRYKEAVALLGSAGRLAQNMGIHRDPSHFPYSPWVCEIRRRSWNHLCTLDSVALTAYGAESCLPLNSDANLPQNADDRDWYASRFAKPSSVPVGIVGLKDMTFVLVHRRCADLARELSRIHCHDYEQKETLINRVEQDITTEYLVHIDMTNPRHNIVAALLQVRLASIRLPIRYRRSEGSVTDRHKVFIYALELLEAYQYHATVYTHCNWSWVFNSIVPWHGLVIVLTEVVKAEEQLDIERAQVQVQSYFKQFSEAPISKTPLWRMLARLREQMGEEAAPTHISPNSDSVIPPTNTDPALVFGDEMMDFASGGLLPMEGSWSNDEMVMQYAQDFPWMIGNMHIPSGGLDEYSEGQL